MRLWKPPHTSLSHDADVSFWGFCLMSWCLSWRSWCAVALKIHVWQILQFSVRSTGLGKSLHFPHSYLLRYFISFLGSASLCSACICFRFHVCQFHSANNVQKQWLILSKIRNNPTLLEAIFFGATAPILALVRSFLRSSKLKWNGKFHGGRKILWRMKFSVSLQFTRS
jgi:hypothetical protein